MKNAGFALFILTVILFSLTFTSDAELSSVAPGAPLNGYRPPVASRGRLGSIAEKLESATRIHQTFRKGGGNIFRLRGGEVYFDSLLELDTDGSRYASQDPTGQHDTALHQPDGRAVDSNAVPYFVLPARGFYQRFGIRLGDIAAVIYRGRIEFAVFADTGPPLQLGEGSIALHRSLGHETIIHGRLLNEGIDQSVITIVFPGSGNGTPQTPNEIRRIGRELFTRLGGTLSKQFRIPSRSKLRVNRVEE